YLRLARYRRGWSPLPVPPNGGDFMLPLVNDAALVHGRLGHFLLLVCLQEGDSATALRVCRVELDVARAIGDEPCLASQGCRRRHARFAVDGLERVLAVAEVPADTLADLQRLLHEEAGHPAWKVGLRGERAFAHRRLAAIRNHSLSYSAERRQ